MTSRTREKGSIHRVRREKSCYRVTTECPCGLSPGGREPTVSLLPHMISTFPQDISNVQCDPSSVTARVGIQTEHNKIKCIKGIWCNPNGPLSDSSLAQGMSWNQVLLSTVTTGLEHPWRHSQGSWWEIQGVCSQGETSITHPDFQKCDMLPRFPLRHCFIYIYKAYIYIYIAYIYIYICVSVILAAQNNKKHHD